MPRHFLAIELALGLCVLGCNDAPSPLPAPPSASAEAESPLTAQALLAIDRAEAAAQRFDASLTGDTPALDQYVAMRREVAAARPFFWRRAQMGSEVLMGPQRSSDEGGGMLRRLDTALADGDKGVARSSMKQVVRALRLIHHELTLNDVRPKDAAQALSDAAYDLGLMLLEADSLVPLSPEAALADIAGTLDGLDAGAKALHAIVAAPSHDKSKPALDALLQTTADIRQSIGNATSSHQLVGRAAMVRQSGLCGIAARRFARELGEEPRLPYKARYPAADNGIDEMVTPLTVPAPRIDTRAGDPKALAAIGRDLFRDKRLSRDDARACIDCHQPDKAFSDGLRTPKSLVATEPLIRNTPSLLYAPLQAAQLWDGQLASAESQALKVIHTDAEMGLTSSELVAVVKESYAERFGAVFPDGVSAANIARVLVAYEVAELVPASSPIDRFDRGDLAALTPEMSVGLDVFAGAGRCARCHIPPLFGGSRPRDFAVPVYSVLGVTKAADKNTPEGKQLDADEGRGKVTGRDIDKFAFKTPTVRNTHLTGPFFHNGSFATLQEVVEFYDDGGGKSRGLVLPNQDPDVRKLDLGPERRTQLVHFMMTALADRDIPGATAPKP